MKIGILTFHSQLNYGGVLQCWALQTALEKMGHEVVVIDRWQDSSNYLLERGYDRMGVKQRIKFWIRSLLGLGDLQGWLRVRRTKRFIWKHLKITSYRFVDWSDAPENLGVDLLIVGSDQVWHCGDWGDPRAYLLEDAPPIPSIAYAASFGMTEIPRYVFTNRKEVETEPIYRRGLQKFRAVSCREVEGVRLCEALGVGVKAEYVVDPVLLLTRDEWRRIAGTRGSRTLVCYFLSADLLSAIPVLEDYVRRVKCRIEVFLDQGMVSLSPLPKNIDTLKKWMQGILLHTFGRVRIRDAAGPKEFLSEIANADAVVSDSFHALMFSMIFNRNVRMLAPECEPRKNMFARIEEFASHVNGPLVSANLMEALKSIERGEYVFADEEWISARCYTSFDFLRKAIG